MRLIDADELIEHVWRDRVDSRERIANLVESMPTIKETKEKRLRFVTRKGFQNQRGGAMTDKEAIKYLKWMRDTFYSDKSHKAFDMAIAALEKQERETQEKPFPFVVGQPAEMFFGGKWVKGKIVAGYRFNDGVVTIETEDGRRIWCGQDRTDIYRPYQEDEA